MVPVLLKPVFLTLIFTLCITSLTAIAFYDLNQIIFNEFKVNTNKYFLSNT